MSTYKYDVQQDINNRTLAANAEQQNRQYWYDRQLQEHAQQFQIEEHQRNFEDWQKQFELENEEYERRIQSQRSYDSISAQVGRAREIGVNPSAAIGVSQQGTAFAAPQPGTVNAPSSPSSPSVSALPAQLHMPFEPTEQFLNIVESLSKLNNSAFSFVDQVRAQQLFMPQLEMAFNEVTNKQLQNAYDKVRNDIQGHTGLNKALSDVLVNYAQAYYHGKMGEKAEVDKLVSEADKTLKGDQHAMFLIDLANLQEKYDLSFKLMKAQTNEADAAAGSYRADVPLKTAQKDKLNAEKQTIDEMRQWSVDKEHFSADKIAASIQQINASTVHTLIETIDKAFGYDVGIGSYLKSILVPLDDDDRSKALSDLVKAIKYYKSDK